MTENARALLGWQATDDVARRVVVALCLLGIALIHLLDTKSKFSETPYLGVGYVMLIAVALIAAEALLRQGTPRRWALAGAAAVAPLIGYIFSRTTGLPGATGDIGNWWEPLGVAALFVEATVIVLVSFALTTRATSRTATVSATRTD